MDAITGIVQSIEKGVPQLAQSCLGGFIEGASQSIQSCVSSNLDKMPVWLSQLTKGSLSKDDFKFLLQSELDLSAMEALKEKGIAEIQLDNFRNGVIALVENAILSTIP
jgi:hypothetical protein